ncbi:unnamed protein product [Arabis nemorensis]|uniref:C2 domain-containing protein n=1 Tax=Arabis nemorensis TaxID=586526 RepID=A0A565CS66_9BRAS|nr:unnamed protein product [Arabis nemorensis]
MISKFTQDAGKKESVASIKKMFSDEVVGELPTRLLTFLELLGQEEEPYGGMSSLQLIIREALASENAKSKLHASQVDGYLFSPRLNPPSAFHSSSCASSSTSTPVTLKIKVCIVAGDQVGTRKVVENNWEPKWGEEFTFTSVNLGADILKIEVYDCDKGEDQFAGMARMFLGQLRLGTRSVPLRHDKHENAITSTSLLMRFTVV